MHVSGASGARPKDRDLVVIRSVSDSDSVRRQNRTLVLEALRAEGPLARTRLAAVTGLSHASITAITQDMVSQELLTDLDETRGQLKLRGRPAVRVGFNRANAYVGLIEIDVSRVRLSLVDYGATLVDRVEFPLQRDQFRQTAPADFLVAGIARLRDRNPDTLTRLRRIAISVQGILDPSGQSLAWSPVAHLAGADLVTPLLTSYGVPVDLTKRGRLLAEGTRWLDPQLRDADVATVFIGSTVAMGLSISERGRSRPDEGATEFGHMNHVPGGATCRCGMQGCIEAYAADYGILRTAYSVPEHTAPAQAIPPADYEQLIARAQAGNRSAIHAFNLAGRALGYGLVRLFAIHRPSHVVFVGPGIRAFPLLRPEIDAALETSLIGRISGLPELRTLRDESEPIFQGLAMQTLLELDRTEMAGLPAARGAEAG